MITFRGLLLLIAGFSIALASIPLSNTYLALIGLGLVFYITFSDYNFERHMRGMPFSSVRTLSMKKAPVGQLVGCKLEMHAGLGLPMRYEDTLPAFFQVKGASKGKDVGNASVKYSFTSPNRGLFYAGPTKVTVNSPSGAFYRELVPDNAEEVLFYPSLSEVKKFDAQLRKRSSHQLLGIRRSVAQGAGTEFIALRKYAVGDELRQIDWKATARTRQLMVRTFEADRKQRVVILLDCGRLMHSGKDVSMLDAGINTAVLLSHVVLSRGDLLGFATFSDKLEYFLQPGNNRSHFYGLLDALGRISPTKETDFIASFRQLTPLLSKRSLIVIISSLQDGGERRVVEAIKLLKAHKHAIVVISPFEPWFEPVEAKDHLVHVIAESAEEKYRKDLDAVASAVKRFGVTVVPVGPNDMTTASLRKYVYAVNEGLATI